MMEYNLLSILLAAPNLLKQFQICLNRQYPVEQPKHSQLSKTNQLIIQNVGATMQKYDQVYISVLQQNPEIFYLPFIAQNS